MKVVIITDQHFGARKNSKLFHDYFLKFYNDIFFPYLEENDIKVVIDMGDTFDSRKGIDFSALAWAKNNYYDRLQDMSIRVHTIVGNHTIKILMRSMLLIYFCVSMIMLQFIQKQPKLR